LQEAHRSGCPIDLTLEVLGDRWSLIVREMIFGDRRRYRELLTRSEEGIASNVLADRLKRLLAAGLLTRADDPRHRQSAIYSLTDPAIQLVPLLAQIGTRGRRHTPASEALSIRAQLLEDGGPDMWEEAMAELRAHHLSAKASSSSVLERLQAAYEVIRASASCHVGEIRAGAERLLPSDWLSGSNDRFGSLCTYLHSHPCTKPLRGSGACAVS